MDYYTVLLFTYNEEQRVEYALRNFHQKAPIIVIDNYSSDDTLEIASRYTDKFFLHKNTGWIDVETSKFAIDKADTDWVYIAMAGELVPSVLLDIFEKVSCEGKYKAVRNYRRSYSYGRWTTNWGIRTGGSRFFTKDAIDYTEAMIHSIYHLKVSEDKILTLPPKTEFSIWQFRDYDVSGTELTHNRYSDIEAKQRFERSERTNPIKLIWSPVREFLWSYVRTGAFRFGMPAFLNAIWRAMMYFNIQARLWEYQEGKTLSQVRQMHADIKENLLAEVEKSPLKEIEH